MDRFYIIANQKKDQNLRVSNDIKKYLEAAGKTCLISSQNAEKVCSVYRYTDASQIPHDIECVLVLGGDGTLIQAARDLSGRNIPLLGVNFGTLGYLAEVEKQNIVPALEQLIANQFTIEKRMMLEGALCRDNRVVGKDVALNDIVISRCGALRVIDFKIYVNGEFLNLYSADGIIISTPTGSTAYNMSAGGPIVSPNASLMVITPICPHTLNTRSIILSSEDIVSIKLCSDRSEAQQERRVSFDGDNSLEVYPNDTITICCSKQQTRIIRLNKISFLEILRNKMSIS